MTTTESEVRQALRSERSSLCDLLERLDAAHWSTQSLCDGWDVHDVVAHLTLSTRTSVLDFAKGMARYRGNFDRMEAERARRRSQVFTRVELIEQLRSDIDSTATAPGSSPTDVLVDFIVHGQDIAIPVGHRHATPPEYTVMALDHVRSSRWYGAKQRIGHAVLQATDIEWSGGDGSAVITGPALDLLLAATGRRAGLDELHGSGLDRLRAALKT